jgi:hypothetical protein
MLSPFKSRNTAWSLFLLLASLKLLTGCGGSSQPAASNSSFAGSTTTQAESMAGPAAQTISVNRVWLNPSIVVGGTPARAKVVLTHAAPAGGAQVLLASANPAVVSLPASVTIAAGQVNTNVDLTTFPVTAGTSVALTANYNNSFAGASLRVNPLKAAKFTLVVQPNSLSLDQGGSASVQVVTTGSAGFNHALQLTLAQPPAGVSASLNPTGIAAPGSGSSQMSVSVDNTVAAGNYPVQVSASDGTTTHAATMNLTVNGSPAGIVGPLHGCMFNRNGHKYQAIRFSMNEPGTVAFDAVLYHGATCTQFADEFGFGQMLQLGGLGYIFWFSDFADQPNTSAIWTVGNQTSQCIDYTMVPDC